MKYVIFDEDTEEFLKSETPHFLSDEKWTESLEEADLFDTQELAERVSKDLDQRITAVYKVTFDIEEVE